MTDRLSGSFEITDTSVRVAVVGPTADAGRADDAWDGVEARLSELGMASFRVDGLAHDADIDDAIDVALLLDATADIGRLSRARSGLRGSATDRMHGCPCRGSTTSTSSSWRMMQRARA